MGVVAFDAKLFQRGKIDRTSEGNDRAPMFHTPLGVGVEIPDERAFATAYLEKAKELSLSFGIPFNHAVFSSRQLKEVLDVSKVRAFSEQLIEAVEEHINRIHCSYAILSPIEIPEVQTGGLDCPYKLVPTVKFLYMLGPIFSYLTANSYLIDHGNPKNYEIHIDAFRSMPTRAWSYVSKTNPKVYWRGDECNPFISAADIMAFLTDSRLRDSWMKLNENHIKACWDDAIFETTVGVFGKNNLDYYTWQSNTEIDISPYLARPILFLAADEIDLGKLSYDDEEDFDRESSARQISGGFKQALKKTGVYYDALAFAQKNGGCVKILDRPDDIRYVKDGDVFAYVGTNSKRVGEMFRDTSDIRLIRGKDIKKTNN